MKRFNLNFLLPQLGGSEILVAPTPAGPDWSPLGYLQNARNFELTYQENVQTAGDNTGGVPHNVLVNVDTARITGTAKLIDAATYADLNPLGIASGGSTQPMPVKEFACALVPHIDIGEELWLAAGVWNKTPRGGGATLTGDAAAPKHSVWFPRCYISHGTIPYTLENGSDQLIDFTITAMFYPPGGELAKVYALGDPNRVGVNYGVVLNKTP